MTDQTRTTISAPAGAWLDALETLTPAVPTRRVPAPILAAVKITPGNTIRVEAFDYETSASDVVHGADYIIGEHRPFLAPHRHLLQVIKTIAGQDRDTSVRLTSASPDEALVTLNYADYEYPLIAPGMIADYPEIPARPGLGFVFKTSDLRNAMHIAGTAASKDDTLPLLGAVQLAANDKGARAWGTDRYRIGAHWAPAVENPANPEPFEFLLSAKVWKAIAKHLPKSGQVKLGVDRDTIAITAGNKSYTVVETTGEYPKIGTLFPEDPTTRVTFTRADLHRAAANALKLSTKHTPIVLRVTPEGIHTSFTTPSGDEAKGPTVLVTSSRLGDDTPEYRTAFNPRFLMEALANLSGSQVTLSATIPAKPHVLTNYPVGPETEQEPRHLLMPVRIPTPEHE